MGFAIPLLLFFILELYARPLILSCVLSAVVSVITIRKIVPKHKAYSGLEAAERALSKLSSTFGGYDAPRNNPAFRRLGEVWRQAHVTTR